MSDWSAWLIGGLILLLLELATPGVFMMWLGLAACGTALIILTTDIGFDLQVVTFAILTPLALYAGLRIRKRARGVNAPPSGLVGRSAIALEFHGREGRVRLGDSSWAARVPPDVAEPPAGTRLRVQGVDGIVLVVRPESSSINTERNQ